MMHGQKNIKSVFNICIFRFYLPKDTLFPLQSSLGKYSLYIFTTRRNTQM